MVAQRSRQTWFPFKLTRRGHVEKLAIPFGAHDPQRTVAEDGLVGVRPSRVDMIMDLPVDEKKIKKNAAFLEVYSVNLIILNVIF